MHRTSVPLYKHWFIKQILLSIKEQIDPDTIIVEDFNTPLSSIHRISRQKINKDILKLNNTKAVMALKNIHREFNPTAAITRFFNSPWNFSKIDHILAHKANIDKYKKIEIVPLKLKGHNKIKLEINVNEY
jgi:hypothetical protein